MSEEWDFIFTRDDHPISSFVMHSWSLTYSVSDILSELKSKKFDHNGDDQMLTIRAAGSDACVLFCVLSKVTAKRVDPVTPV